MKKTYIEPIASYLLVPNEDILSASISVLDSNDDGNGNYKGVSQSWN